MRAEHLGHWPAGSPEWHAARMGRLGGSDMGVLIGHGFRSRADLLLEKLGEAEPLSDSPALARGRWLEPALLAYAADRGHVADHDLDGTYAAGWRLANPDGITAEGVLIECKSTSWRDPEKWGRGGSDQIPAGYLAQVTWCCGLLGLDRWVVPVVATKPTPGSGHAPSGFDWALYKGRFNPDFFRYLERLGQRFMDDLKGLQA